MTSQGITYFLELRNVRKLLMHLVLVNFKHFFLGFPRMAPICGQQYLCTAVRVKPKVYMAWIHGMCICIIQTTWRELWREQN